MSLASYGRSLLYRQILKMVVKFLVLKVVPIFLLVVLIVSIPMIIVTGVKDAFNQWFKGREAKYTDNSKAVYDWVDSLKEDINLGYGYITRKQVKDYIIEQDATYIQDKKLTIPEKITITVTDSKNGNSHETKHTKYHDYTLALNSATYDYRLPWQIMLSVNTTADMNYSPALKNDIRDAFKSNFFGLFNSNEITPVSYDEVTSNSSYRYYKKVITKKTSIHNYTEIETRTTHDEEGNTHHSYIEHHYKKTTVTVSEINYPKPYFTRIETTSDTYNFEYENNETRSSFSTVENGDDTTIETTIIDPQLKNVVPTSAAQRFYMGLKKFGINADKNYVDYMKSSISELPYSDFPVMILNSILRSSQQGYDIYGGIESGSGAFKLSGEGILAWPTNGPVKISSGYGLRFHPVLKIQRMHTGIDIVCDSSMKVLSSKDGRVEFAGDKGDYGNTVIISHGNGISTLYAHMQQISVRVGDVVKTGQIIGIPGSTGLSTGVHLHFEAIKDGIPVDPAQYLGLIPDVPEITVDELKYTEIDSTKIKEILRAKNSFLVTNDRYINAINNAGKAKNVNPLLLYSITGAEMSFVVNDYTYWQKVYDPNNRGILLGYLQKISPNATIQDAPFYIAQNCFNVFHSWWEHNVSIEEASMVAAATVAKSLSDVPKGRHPVLWINVRDGKNGYAEDPNWFRNVSRIYIELKTKMGGQ
mgnify:CR=1 FL=1